MLPCPICQNWYKDIERHFKHHDGESVTLEEAVSLQRDMAMLSMKTKVLLSSSKVGTAQHKLQIEPSKSGLFNKSVLDLHICPMYFILFFRDLEKVLHRRLVN